MVSGDIRIARTDIESTVARTLIDELNAELMSRYPEAGANHFRVDPEEVAEGRGAFVVAYRDGKAVGCGAVRLIGNEDAEIKRMYTCKEARGLGIGGRVLGTLEEMARSLGARRLVLETGIRQGEALHVYERAGFKRIPLYGEYATSPMSICMAKWLGP